MEFRYFSKNGDPGFACQCGCGAGFDDMDRDFMRRLDQARMIAGVPFRINSGYRCPEHNAKVSSTGANGPHTSGKAVDIATPDNRTRHKVLTALVLSGFHRIGVARTFIHVDDDETKDREVVWLYG